MIPKNKEDALAAVEVYVSIVQLIKKCQTNNAKKSVPDYLQKQQESAFDHVPHTIEEWVDFMNLWMPLEVDNWNGPPKTDPLTCGGRLSIKVGPDEYFIHDAFIGFLTGLSKRSVKRFNRSVVIANRILLPGIGLRCGCWDCRIDKNSTWLGKVEQLLLFDQMGPLHVHENLAISHQILKPTSWWYKEFFDHSLKDEDNPNLIVVNW